MKKCVVFITILFLTACMGKPEKKPVKDSFDDAQMAKYKDTFPKCHDQEDDIICDWGKDKSDSTSAYPIISALLPERLAASLLNH